MVVALLGVTLVINMDGEIDRLLAWKSKPP